jgi:hypothetical protein
MHTATSVYQYPSSGLISVSSNPSGAGIFLDNSSTGQITPFTLTNVSPGSHAVSVSLSGYTSSPSFLAVTVPSGGTANAQFSLTHQFGPISLEAVLGILSIIGGVIGLYLIVKFRIWQPQPPSNIGKQFPIIMETRGGIEGVQPNQQNYDINWEVRGGVERL